MKKFIKLNVLLLILLLSSLAYSSQKQINITFVSPSTHDHDFWGIAHNFARATAKDLGINFKVIYVKKANRYTYLHALESAFTDTVKPDFIIAHFFNTTVIDTLNFSKKYDIPMFMVNSAISREEKNDKYLRNIYPNFLGHMFPNEVQAGYLLAQYLIQKQKMNHPNQIINVVGITGHRETSVTHERNEGLRKAAHEENAIIKQIAFTDWSGDMAFRLSQRLIFRNDDLHVFWAASDSMSISIKKSVLESNKESQIITGGIDWTKDAIKRIKSGKLDASVGGHFTEVGFALVLLYDYMKGKDFYEELGGTIKTEMSLLTKENIDKYYKLLTEQNWENIDFTKYSKTLNPKVKKYNFSFETLIENQ